MAASAQSTGAPATSHEPRAESVCQHRSASPTASRTSPIARTPPATARGIHGASRRVWHRRASTSRDRPRTHAEKLPRCCSESSHRTSVPVLVRTARSSARQAHPHAALELHPHRITHTHTRTPTPQTPAQNFGGPQATTTGNDFAARALGIQRQLKQAPSRAVPVTCVASIASNQGEFRSIHTLYNFRKCCSFWGGQMRG